MIRYSLVALLFLLTSINLTAQVEVGITSENGNKNNFSSSDVIQIKNSKLLVDVPEASRDAFNSALQAVWEISDFTFSTDDTTDNTGNNNQLVCSISIEQGQNGLNFVSFCDITRKNHLGESERIARFPLQMSASLNNKLRSQAEGSDLRSIVYANPDFHNITAGLLELNLMAINNQLSLGKTIWLDEDISKGHLLRNLKDGTLHIPSYCLIKSRHITVKEEELNEEKLMKKYPYSWDVNRTTGEGRFLLLSAQTGSTMYIGIIDNISGQIIYQTKKSNQFNLKRSDFKEISKEVG
ncbi:MAG: hypothetical protein ACLFM1_04145 [Bacteroidales bacterium]